MSGSSIVSGLSLHNRENHPALDVFTIRFRPNRTEFFGDSIS
jgi:hypothetical protein